MNLNTDLQILDAKADRIEVGLVRHVDSIDAL